MSNFVLYLAHHAIHATYYHGYIDIMHNTFSWQTKHRSNGSHTFSVYQPQVKRVDIIRLRNCFLNEVFHNRCHRHTTSQGSAEAVYLPPFAPVPYCIYLCYRTQIKVFITLSVITLILETFPNSMDLMVLIKRGNASKLIHMYNHLTKLSYSNMCNSYHMCINVPFSIGDFGLE